MQNQTLEHSFMANTEATNNGTILGLFSNERQAGSAMEKLRAAGFNDSEIGVATSSDESKVGDFWDTLKSKFGKQERTEHATDLEESLRHSGIPSQRASYFNSQLGRGGVLITVHAGAGRSSEALSILQRNGADVGNEAANWNAPQGATSREEGRNIQLLGEILRVHKERVSRGEVRLRKEVITEQQNIEVPTTREELVIERVPGQGREASGAEIGSGEKEIRVPLTEERISVEKKPVVNEEIRVGKRQVQDTKRISDQVRHEELRTDGEVEDERNLQRRDEKTKRSA
jgi:uncharacterized protein (TIGR02271 family)